MTNYLLNNWFLIALIAPLFWALVNIIDVYFVEQIYDNEYDGTVITGLFQILPWLMIPFIGLVVPDAKIAIMAMLGGFCIVASYFFYFKALFITSDSTLILILWNSVAIFVPILAFLFLQEKLTLFQYLGIILTFLGVMYLSFDQKIKEKNILKVIAIMSATVLLWSASMILAKSVYSNTSFQGGIMFFSLGSMLTGLFFYVLRQKKHEKGNLVAIGRKYFKWFLLSEILTLSGIVTSQRAIDLSPSVSFVAVIESIQPAFIVISSAVIFIIISRFSNKNKEVAKRIHSDQLVGISSKIYAIIVMAIGIYMINI
jgi:drug/metabolite transporter (DMT)-like permease